MSKIKSLVVDDEPYLLDLTKIFLEGNEDIEVVTAGSAEEALARIENEDFDVLVSDYQMPSMDGLQLLRAIKDKGYDLPFILFTGKGRESVAVDALNLGASYYLQKGGDPGAQFTELANIIRRSDESQRAKRQLKESENRFRTLVQNSSDFITIVDGNGIVIYSSSSIERILGYDEKFLVGKSPLEIIHPDDHEKVLTELRLVKENRQDGLPAEFRVKNVHGHYLMVEAIGSNMFGVPNVDGMVITTRSIVERKKVESALRESEELYHTLFDKSPLSMTLNGVDGRFVDVNEKHQEMVGMKKGDIVGKTPVDLGYIDGSEYETLSELVLEKNGTMDRYPTSIMQTDGRKRHLMTSARLINFNGKAHVLMMNDDMTDLVEVKQDLQAKTEELERERARLQMIADLTPSIVYQLLIAPDGNLQFLFVSKGAENILHLPVETWQNDIGRVMAVILDEDSEPLMASVVDAMVSKKLWEKEFRILDVDGTMKWILGTASPSPVQADGSDIWTGIFTDITERKRSEDALRRMNRQLNLMASITRHDCLNKIAAAFGYLELASRRVSDNGTKDILTKAASSVTAIRSELELTGDLQDLSGQDPVWQSLGEIVRRSSTIYPIEGMEGGQDLELYANPMLEKVFQNLVDNSVRHGEHVKTIRLECKRDEKGLTLVYEDDGIGIPSGEKERIFLRGYGKNTGLGLFLIQEILNMTCITIVENGIPGEGARFEIRVPLGGYRYRA
ncbi:MAG TPA: PAS domain S-box protein [Methanomassiliicoccales archaeon]|jgi:PAS domain S-box-containing protein